MHGRADVGGEDGVLGGEPVDGRGDVLRVQRRVVGVGLGEAVELCAGPR